MPFDAAPATNHAATLDAFLASVERRGFRMAELALGHREDALDAVQEAMIKLVSYRDRPPAEWAPLFWSILRRQVTDRHRRNAVRRRVLSVLGRADEEREDPLEMLPDPHEDPARRHADAAAWSAVPAATAGATPIINGRFAQVQVRMRPGTDALSTPELRDFTLRWNGGRRYVDIAGIFSEGPDHGIYELQVNGAPVLQGVTVKVSVFKDVRLASGAVQRMESSAFAEIVPRN